MTDRSNPAEGPAASLARFAETKLAQLEAGGLRRRLVPTARTDGVHLERDGRPLLSFCCNDYLGLTARSELRAAARDAVARYGTGAGASRLVTGDHPLLGALEARLAAFKGTEDCVVFGSGYLANLGIVPALAGPGDLVLADALAHACLNGGAKLSGARVIRFPHNDIAALAQILERERAAARHALILTDGVFSMDGDMAPIGALADLAETHDAWLLTDDAHGLGVVGGGRGAAHAQGVAHRVPLQMGTLSKAAGAYGGYVCCTKPVAELLRNRARSFVYSTGLPPAATAAALEALRIIETEPETVARPVALAARFAARVGLPEPQSPVVPIVLGEARAALAASAALEAQGFLVLAIRPPTVPEGTARLRVTFTAQHTEAEADALADAIAALGAQSAAAGA